MTDAASETANPHHWKPIGASREGTFWAILLTRYDPEAGVWEFNEVGLGAGAMSEHRLDLESGEWLDAE